MELRRIAVADRKFRDGMEAARGLALVETPGIDCELSEVFRAGLAGTRARRRQDDRGLPARGFGRRDSIRALYSTVGGARRARDPHGRAGAVFVAVRTRRRFRVPADIARNATALS